ncbi:MAG TPA: mannose-1-phosphate guanylyltransferase/mannose-6-phosphate isomerase [Rhodocyclaceae bacterium]|nr:mannose-1-phosphate guanylyltransferase/mannose-6-phosphate isomerase [Rhodocyclaceae bacterium]
MQIQPVILSGGSGTRLWPLSRTRYPKQLLALTSECSLLQDTALRIEGAEISLGITPSPIVVCNEEYRFITAEQLREVGKPARALVLEPVGRNTAPAVALAALAAMHAGEDPILLIMPADHVITDRATFCRAVELGARQAAQGAVVTFGIVPDRPETGYGYIRAGDAIEGGDGARVLSRFVEKPDRSTAESYLSDGGYLWNSGIFMGRAGLWLELMSRYRADIEAACQAAYAAGSADADFFRVARELFSACPSDSIDYAVMEPLTAESEPFAPAVVVPLDAGWSDVGAWDSLWQVVDKDENGNAVRGDVLLQDTHDSLVYAEGRLVACLGIRDAVVVETPDAIMVAAKDRTQDVKSLVTRLQTERREQAEAHRKVYRPWGSYDSIDAGDRFQVKRIVVKPGAALSLQMHYHRAEHWIVVRGTARVVCGDRTILLGENESTYIPLGTQHRLENPGKVPLEIIEVQSGAYLGEDDIVRFEDVYGRN